MINQMKFNMKNEIKKKNLYNKMCDIKMGEKRFRQVKR